MKKYLFFLITVLTVCMLAIAVYAKGPCGVGTTAANFLKFGIGARASAMADSFSSIADDATAIYWNPAGLVELDRKNVSFTHLEYLEGIRYEWVGYAHPFQTASRRKLASTKVLLVDDFDDGTDPNFWNGGIGTWSDQDRGGYSSIVAWYYNQNLENVYGGTGSSYEVSYLVEQMPDGSPGEAGLWIGLDGRSIAEKQYLVFAVKGTEGNEQFKIGLKDTSYREVKIPITSYATVSTQWQVIVVPISDFKGIDTASMDNISFTFDGQGTVYIDNLGFGGVRKRKTTIGASVAYLTSGSMTKYIEISEPPYWKEQGSFDASNLAVSLSIGHELFISRVRIPVGITAKYIREQLDTENNPGFAFDLGFRYLYEGSIGNVAVGLVLQNMGYASKMKNISDALPFTSRLGTSYLLPNKKFMIAMDVDMPIDGVTNVSIGAEYTPTEFLFARAGYMFGKPELLAGLRAGLGIKLNSFQIDYAFCPYATLGIAHRVSASYKFGKTSN